MSKRFTDTNKYKKPFIRGLQGPYKLLWDYLYHDCDHAGIWIVDFDVAQIYIGKDMQVNYNDALKFFNDGEIRIIEFDHGKKWFIPSFIEFQYGQLNEQNRAHNSVILILKKYNLFKRNKPLVSPLQGAMDMDMDKDKDKDKDIKGSMRGKKDFLPPNFEEVKKYFIEHDCTEKSAKMFFESYSVADWHDSKGNQIKNWKQKAIQVWFTNEKNHIQKTKVDTIHVPTKEEYENSGEF